ncbi:MULTISPECIES: Crp/Fnr family transcriptional regulator [Olivibacter]|uniref:Crp/Fnr family transcriptional regulator n=1 Tax=Olivibacter jilunii TaxID=985016 RepID=A0ABW6B5E0_9SPHI
MERFFTYAEQYCMLAEQEKQFIIANCRLRSYGRHDYYLLAGEYKTNWCFMLDGSLAAFKIDSEGGEFLQWLSVKNQYFTGSKHAFSYQPHGLQLKFLQSSELLEFPYSALRMAQHRYPAFAEFLHVMKEQKLKHFQALVKILKLPPAERMYKALEDLNSWATILKVDECCDLLDINHRWYYQGLKRHLKG